MGVSIGILFNGFVSAVVAGVAGVLLWFLRQRYRQLNPTMRAYAWFWWFTALVWLPSTVRYGLAGTGYVGPWLRYLDATVQAAVFFSGPPLVAYTTLRLVRSERLANLLCLASFALGCVSLWFVLQPQGIPIRDVSFFSADATINPVSFIIFSAEAGLILFFLLLDIGVTVRRWRHERQPGASYEILYSAAIVVYLALGSIDESKVLVDWPLVVFRMLYAGAFLAVYLTMAREEASRTSPLVSAGQTAARTYAA